MRGLEVYGGCFTSTNPRASRAKSRSAAEEKTLLVGHSDDAELLYANLAHHFAIGFTNIVVVTVHQDDAAAIAVGRFDRRHAFHYVIDEKGGDPLNLFSASGRWAIENLATPFLAICDTDEFFVSRNGSIRQTRATALYDLVAIPRYTVVPTRDAAGALVALDFSHPQALPVAMQSFEVKDAWLSGDRSVPYVFAKDAAKIITRTPFVKDILLGGHGVITNRPFLTRSIDEDLAIVHAPFTTLPRFERKVAAVRKWEASYGDHSGPEIAWQWRSWATLDEAQIRDEFEAQVCPSTAPGVTTVEKIFKMSDAILPPTSPDSFTTIKEMVEYLEPIEARELPDWMKITFDSDWYLDQYSDARNSGEHDAIDPLRHFLTIGIVEGRSPAPDFDPHFVRKQLERITGNYLELRDVYWLYFSLPPSERPATLAPEISAKDVLLRFYDTELAKHGDSAQGAGWPNEADRKLRFDVMLDVARKICGDGPMVLGDYGCGTGELLSRIRERGLSGITYAGFDMSEAALEYARAKFPEVAFTCVDPAGGDGTDYTCDVLVANGVFTARLGLSEGEMWTLMTQTLERIWPYVRRGIVFNVMSKIVDWERDDLFHVSYDAMASFLHYLAGRRIGFRADYGLYEYIAYATKESPYEALRDLP